MSIILRLCIKLLIFGGDNVNFSEEKVEVKRKVRQLNYE